MKSVRSSSTAFQFDPAVKDALSAIVERDGLRRHANQDHQGYSEGTKGQEKITSAASSKRISASEIASFIWSIAELLRSDYKQSE